MVVEVVLTNEIRPGRIEQAAVIVKMAHLRRGTPRSRTSQNNLKMKARKVK